MADGSVGPPSMREVAVRAGVSHQTVSRVINGHSSIRPETRDRVLAAIDELGYRPNSAARALASRRSGRIGVVVDAAEEMGPSATVRAVEKAIREAGYAVSVATVGDAGQDDPAHAVEHLLDQGIEALCIIAPRESVMDVARERAEMLPTLVVTSATNPDYLTAHVDQRLGARLATEHLISLGHRHIAHLAGPLDWLDAQGRAWGWRQALIEASLDVPEVAVGDWTASSGYEWALSWPDEVPWTAVFCANDQMALGVLHGATERGISVPGSLSVVGFDDVTEARHFLPPLTTVRQDFQDLGKHAVAVLLASLDGGDGPASLLIEPELMVRASTGPVAAR